MQITEAEAKVSKISDNFITTEVGLHLSYSGVPRNFVRGGSTNSVEDRG